MNPLQSLVAVRFVGTDASDFLQGYVTCDMDDLTPNLASPGAFANRDGRIVANGWFFGSTAEVTFVTHHSTVDLVKTHLKIYLPFSKSEIESATQPMALKILGSKESLEIANLNAVLVQEEQTDAELFDILIRYKCPLVTDKTSGLFLPQMLNLTEQEGLSFDKGCYLGQEVLARAEHRGKVKRRMLKYSITSGELRNGETVDDGKGNSGTVFLTSSTEALVVTNSTNSEIANGSLQLRLVA